MGRWFYHQFTDEKTEVQQGSVTYEDWEQLTWKHRAFRLMLCFVLLTSKPLPPTLLFLMETRSGRKPGKEKGLRTRRLP